MRFLHIVVLATFFCGASAQARVFKFDSGGIATYFGAGVGDATLLKDAAYGDSSGASTTFSSSDIVPYTQSVEFGVLLSVRNKVSMRVNAQIVQARKVVAEGDNSSGTKLMDLTSELYVFNPNVVVEVNFSADSTSRWFGYAGAGQGTLSMDNTYSLTAAGSSAYAVGVTDFVEKVEATMLTYDVGAGYEILAVDNTTFNINLGYRFMDGRGLKYKSAGNNLSEADFAHAKGDDVLNNDGSKRTTNLGGPYISFGFRFYISFI